MTGLVVPDTDPPTARTRATLALAVAVLLLLAAGVIGATKSRAYFVEVDRADQRASALAAGKQLAFNFVTMDYRKFDSYGSQVLGGASGPFLSQYTKGLADLKKVVLANKSVSVVKQIEAGLVSSDADSAVVIVGVVAPTSNTSTPQPVVKTYRMRLDLQRASAASGPWKVSSLEFVG